jgi:hypothetical protein
MINKSDISGGQKKNSHPVEAGKGGSHEENKYTERDTK